jgi:dolichyl-phosphate-mannose--protein O-mannosyl transferase
MFFMFPRLQEHYMKQPHQTPLEVPHIRFVGSRIRSNMRMMLGQPIWNYLITMTVSQPLRCVAVRQKCASLRTYNSVQYAVGCDAQYDYLILVYGSFIP